MTKTTKKLKTVVCLLLALVILSTTFAVSAGASNTNYVKIKFYKPADWSSNVKIHLWNAGSLNTSWPGIAMTQNSDGTYEFTSYAISSCNFVINDSNGKQTADLYASGSVGVKDNTVFETSDKPSYLYFEKPANWSSDIKVYYYTNDNNSVSLMSWPGVSMNKNYNEDTYYYNISDMANVRVLFTDGTHQYPAVGEPGIPVSAGEELVFQNNSYTVNEHNWIQIEQNTSYAYVNQDFHVIAKFNYGNDFPLFFYDENNNIVSHKSYTKTSHNGIITYDFTFNFAQVGSKNLTVKYYYHSSEGYTGKTVKVNVIENTKDNQNIFYSDKYQMNQGDTFEVAALYNSNLSYAVFNDKGEKLSPVSTYVSMEGYKEDMSGVIQYIRFRFKADELGQYQKLHLYTAPSSSSVFQDTGNFIGINVWTPAAV